MYKFDNKFQRESLRRSLSRSEPIDPAAGIDVNELARAASTRLYSKRWLILVLLTLLVFGIKFQWFQYTVILNVVVKFFNVSPMAVKATAVIYNVSFIIALYPFTWLIHARGVRFVCVLASASICLGTWLKYFAISPDRLSLVLVGQFIIGAWFVASETLPSQLASHWFGLDEVATATALGGTGSVVGIALSYFLGPLVVKSHEDLDEIGHDLKSYLLPLALCTTCVLFLVFFLFSEGPRLPPSKSRALQKLCTGEDLELLKIRLMKNRNYILLLNAHSLIVGEWVCVFVSLNSLYMPHFKNGEQDIGRMGLLIVVCGYCASLIFARILDRFKIFKLILIIACVGNILAILMLATSMYFEVRWAVYVSIAMFGLFTQGYYTPSFETCAELTYPEPIMIGTIIMILGHQVSSSIFVVCIDKLMLAYSDVAAYAFLLAISIVGCILTCITRDERRRHAAGNLQ